MRKSLYPQRDLEYLGKKKIPQETTLLNENSMMKQNMQHQHIAIKIVYSPKPHRELCTTA